MVIPQRSAAPDEMFFLNCLIRVKAEIGCQLNLEKEGDKVMRIKSNVKAGRLTSNHNQTVKGLRVKSNVKAGKLSANHNQTVARHSKSSR